MTPRVLLADTSRWASTARVAIGFAKRGCRVYGVCPSRHPMAMVRAIEGVFPYDGVRPMISLAEAITAVEPHIVVPGDDRATEHLHELYEQARSFGAPETMIAGLIERSLGFPGSYPVLDSRYQVMRIAREEGIRVPDTDIIDSVDDLNRWGLSHAFPWVLKATGTWGGQGVRTAQSFEQAKARLRELVTLFRPTRVIKRSIVNRDSFCLRSHWDGKKPTVVVQSYIQGRPANCAVACWQGKVLAGTGVEVVSSLGLTGPASVVRVVRNSDMMLAAERLVGRLGLSGLFGFDFMIEDHSSEAYLIEINPRSTPLSHLHVGTGPDMIGALSAQLSGETLHETQPDTLNDMIAYFPQALASKSRFLETSFLDVPENEPELIRELKSPWPDRSILFRLCSRLAPEGNAISQIEYEAALSSRPPQTDEKNVGRISKGMDACCQPPGTNGCPLSK